MQFGDEARHLFLERFAVVFDFLGADVAAGREDVAVGGDFFCRGGFAEAGDVGVRRKIKSAPFRLRHLPPLRRGRDGIAAPGVVGVGDAGDIGIGEFAVNAVDQGAEFAGVDEQGLFAAVAKTVRGRTLTLPSTGGRGFPFLFFARNHRQTGICVL